MFDIHNNVTVHEIRSGTGWVKAVILARMISKSLCFEMIVN